MKKYKVESLIFYSKPFANKNHIAEKSKEVIQTKLDEYAQKGYSLSSTSSCSFGLAIYIHLYFEK